MEKIINDKVDKLLSEMEVYFKEAVEGNKPLQEELNAEVKKLMDAFDEREEVRRFQEVKDISDYIALTIGMPLKEGTKERIIEELVEEVKRNGKSVSSSV